MQKYKIIVAYDGTDYHGWQLQPNNVSVSQVLQDTFYKIFKKKIKLIGASRTDAGVHAEEQVATFNFDLDIDARTIQFAWNNLLPININIKNLTIADDTFHPLVNVKQKIYYYHIFYNQPNPLLNRFVYWPKYKFNKKKLNEALQIFVGTHDFRSFCTGNEKENTIRTIHSIEIEEFNQHDILRIIIKGPSFLQYMIRRIVGASLDIAKSKNRTIEDLKFALNQKNPKQTFYTVPARGLILQKILYTN